MRSLTTPVPLRHAQAMTRIEKDDAIKAAVLISAKPGSWIAGANIKMLENLESGAAAEEVAGIGQKGMDRIAAMQKTKPWVAAIDGERFAKTLKPLASRDPDEPSAATPAPSTSPHARLSATRPRWPLVTLAWMLPRVRRRVPGRRPRGGASVLVPCGDGLAQDGARAARGDAGAAARLGRHAAPHPARRRPELI